MEAQRASNLVVHAEEIKSRPQKTWFQTAAEKKQSAAVRVFCFALCVFRLLRPLLLMTMTMTTTTTMMS